MPALLRPLLLAGLAIQAALLPARASNDEAIAVLNLARFQLPEYPAALRQLGVTQGNVIVAIETRRTTASPVDDFLILSSSEPRFAESVTRALGAWRFAAPKATPTSANAANPADGPTIVRFQFVSTGVVTLTVPAYAALQAKAGPDALSNRVLLPTFADLDENPAPVTQPMPAYPADLRSQPIPGNAVVKFFLDADGRVRMPSVTSATDPAFGKAALSVLGNWRFQPPRLKGEPTVAIGTWTFNFGPQNRGT